MKKLFYICIFSLLTGCSVLDLFSLDKFDSTQYHMITQIRYSAHSASNSCDDFVKSQNNARQLLTQTQMYKLYKSELKNSKDGLKSAEELDAITQELANRYNNEQSVTTEYCQIKFKSIEFSAELIQKVEGKRPK